MVRNYGLAAVLVTQEAGCVAANEGNIVTEKSGGRESAAQDCGKMRFVAD